MTTRRNQAVPPCPRKCRGGHKCVCTIDYPHTHHICNRPGCICHQPAAYGLEAEKRHDVVWRYVRREEVQG